MTDEDNQLADSIGFVAQNSPVSIGTFNQYQAATRAKLKGIPQNIPIRGITKFVGRETELTTLHAQLGKADGVSISAIVGMGGVGKTELATQYAVQFAQNYPGGVCWLNAKETDLVTQILSFARLVLGLKLPSELEKTLVTLDQQLDWYLQYWQPKGQVLVVLDDASETTLHQSVVQKLPPRFRVLITTRRRGLDASFFELPLDVLSLKKALEVLTELIGHDRIQPEEATAQQLCAWLGYLPLGLELVGRYVAAKPFLSLAEMQERLNIQHEAIAQRPRNYVMTGQRSVTAAFELSWEELNDKAQEMGRFLSLFAADAIPWSLVKWVTEAFEWTTEEMEAARTALYHRSLLQKVDQTTFRLHPLIQEFLAFKLAHSEQADQVRATFVKALVAVVKKIPFHLTLDQIQQFKPTIPHVQPITRTQLELVTDEDLIYLFLGLGRFYESQGLYAAAEPWYEKCVEVVRNQLGKDYPQYYVSLHLARIHALQKRYFKAEPLYQKSLRLTKQQLGEDHLRYAVALNGLAELYREQGRYSEAEPLYQKSLQLTKQQLGKDCLNYAVSLHNLALTYQFRANFLKFPKATFLLIQALKINVKTLGWKHPNTRTTISNLIGLLLWEASTAFVVINSALFFLRTQSFAHLLEAAICLLLIWLLLRQTLLERLWKLLCGRLLTCKKKQR